MIFRALLVFTLFFTFNGCTKKPTKDHARFVTLKLAPDVKVSLTEVVNSNQTLILKPVILSSGDLSDVKVKVIQQEEGKSAVNLFNEDFTRHNFTADSLKNIEVQIADENINNKIVLIVSGKLNGKDFNVSAIHNSLFQKEIDDAKLRLQKRSSQK